MSPRAAWRLEALGFSQVYDYVAGKVDWGAAGLPREGTATTEETMGEVADANVPTCRLDERLRDVQERVRATDWDTCIVVNEEQVVLGRLGRKALAETADVIVEEVMAEGPSTVRPTATLRETLERLRPKGNTTALVTTSDGRLVGVVCLDR